MGEPDHGLRDDTGDPNGTAGSDDSDDPENSAGSDDDPGVEYELDDVHPDGAAGVGSPARSVPGVGMLLAAVTVLGLLALVLTLFGAPGDWAGRTAPAPTSSPTASTTASPTASSLPSTTATSTATGDVEPDPLAVTDVNGARELLPRPQAGLSVVSLCSPQSDGAGHLRVGLQVVNAGSTTVRLLDVRPRLRAGLVRLTGLRSGGSCGAPGDGDISLDLAPAARVLVTMELAILDTCPGAVPVGVRVRAKFADGLRTVSFPLFANLGSVIFDGC